MLRHAQKREVLALISESDDDRPLPPEKELRLRALVGHELPLAAKLPWKDLLYNATYMVGVWSFTGSLEAEA